MSLLSSPQARNLLGQIRDKFHVGSGQGALDQFFWLHAERGLDTEPVSIRPAWEASVKAPKRLCNLVLQGGGTLGLAHAGFVTGLEAAGIRFAGLAGTSAGSILAMGIAAIRGRDLLSETSARLVEITDAVPMDSFIDGPRPLRIFIKRALKGHPIAMPQYWRGLLAALLRLRDRRGLNHGTAFESWFETVMTEEGVGRIEDLYAALDAIWDDLGDLRNLHPLGPNRAPVLKGHIIEDPALGPRPSTALLQLVSLAMPVGINFRLPQDLHCLGPDYQETSPARLVRTSMSIPAFFEPVVMRTNPKTWGQKVRAELGGLLPQDQQAQFEALKELVFLDGGMTSNLPSDSFRDLMPDVPTIVVPLVRGGAVREITRRRRFRDLLGDAAACASAVRLQRDREIWSQNRALSAAFDVAERAAPEVASGHRPARRYPVAIAPIDTGEANWLNFVMPAQEKAALFEAGLQRAHDLLETLSKGETP